MNHPKISIVTPSYNQGQYLEDTILSVLGQNYPNLEYLIYDAASSDNSVEIIKKYENQLSYWVSEKDEGQADAINKGFSKSSGDILMWLNSDDILMPNVLTFIAKQFKEKGEGIYYGNCIHFKDKLKTGVHAHGSNVNKNFNEIPLELADTIIQPSSFWSRNVWLTNGDLEKRFHFGFDWEWFLRAKRNNIPFYSFNKPLSLYRFHEAHKTGVGGSKRQDELHEIYSIYSPDYAKLYDLIRFEKYDFNILQKIIIKLQNVLFKTKISQEYLLKSLKFNKYKNYSVDDIKNIKGML
jgi:glycosyltransferase involved in cell wall biosynthesis